MFGGEPYAEYPYAGPGAVVGILPPAPSTFIPFRDSGGGSSGGRPPTKVQRRGWRYFATRLNGDGTETMIHPDLPIEDVEIEDVISGHNALSGTIEPSYSNLIASDGQTLLREWGTAIYAENNGDIRGGGILVSSDFDGPEWGLECVGFTGYAQDLPWTGAPAVTNSPPGWSIPDGKDGSGFGVRVDPLDMVRVIWDQIQGYHGGNLGLVLGSTDTGGKVSIGTTLNQGEFDSVSGPLVYESGPFKLNWYEHHDLAGDIDALATETPFDYHERHYWDGDTIVHSLDFGYPKIGRRRTDLRFVYGVNVFETPQIKRDGDIYASGTMVLGAGNGSGMIKSIRETPTRPIGRLRRIAVVTDDTIKSPARAARRANAENQWRAHLDDIDSVVVRDHPNAKLGAVKVGDEIRLEGPGDWVDIDMWVRVTAIKIRPSDSNQAEYSVARTDKLLN